MKGDKKEKIAPVVWSIWSVVLWIFLFCKHFISLQERSN